MTIDWIRHTSLKVDGSMCYGHLDVPVSDNFAKEAEDLKRRIAGRDYQEVFTSPLSRAQKLCHYCGYLDAKIDTRIIEFNFGSWEGTTWEDLLQGRSLDEWFGAWHKELPADAETLEGFHDRIKSFINEMTKKYDSRIAVFCHGGVINMARYMQGIISLEDCFRNIQPYGSVTTLSY